MSRENPQTENALPDPPEKHTWHVNPKTNPRTYEAILDEAKREQRSISWIVSRALEKLYEPIKIKVV